MLSWAALPVAAAVRCSLCVQTSVKVTNAQETFRGHGCEEQTRFPCFIGASRRQHCIHHQQCPGKGQSGWPADRDRRQVCGEEVREAAVRVGDLNEDGTVDQEDAKIANAKAKRIMSKVADKSGTLAKELAKHDMVKDAAAGAAIGAAVGIPVPVIGPAAGAAIGAIVGVAKNLRSATHPASKAPGKESKPSTVKSAIKRIRKPRQPAQS